MSDETVTNRNISVSFNRKVSDGNYGGSEATAWVQGDIPPDASPQAIAEALANLFQSAKAAVLDELGVGWHVDDQGIVRETETPFVSTQHAQAAVQRQTNATVVQGTLKVMNAGKPGVSTEPLPAWLLSETAADGTTAVWDQRHEATGNQPLFREACQKGQGKGKNGMPKGYWPPK